jgi:hypothetical protein
MFWKLIRWGGTLIVMLLVLAATVLSQRPEDTATPVQPAEAETPSKNFNF